MTEEVRQEYNSALLAYKADPCEHNRERLESVKRIIQDEVNGRFMDTNRIFDRQMGR